MTYLFYSFVLCVLTYFYRKNLLFYSLQLYSKYNNKINKYVSDTQKKYGYPIVEIKLYENYYYIMYTVGFKNYIMYINVENINKIVNEGKILLNKPYNIDDLNKKDNMNINSDDNIISAETVENNKCVIDFCKMISGPKGNFYEDVVDVLKPTSDLYKNDLEKFYDIKLENHKIKYMISTGDEYETE